MSRREGRDSDSRRPSSRLDREPSPKRSRRDGKPETERIPSNGDVVGENVDRDQKHGRRLQDALPLEAPEAPHSKVENGASGGQSDKKRNGNHEGVKRSSDPTEVPRSRSYFQHVDDRSNGRSFGRRAAPERGRLRDSRDHQHVERAVKRYDKRQRDEKSEGKGEDHGSWRHDKYYEIEANLPPPPPPPTAATRKRPAFTEKKILGDSENTDIKAKEPEKAGRIDQPVSVSERREDSGRKPRHSDRHERPNRDDARKSGISSRGRHGGEVRNGRGGYFQERERFNGRQGYRPSTTRAEKWMHDMYVEANKSPPRKNEEDEIAKVEALLAS